MTIPGHRLAADSATPNLIYSGGRLSTVSDATETERMLATRAVSVFVSRNCWKSQRGEVLAKWNILLKTTMVTFSLDEQDAWHSMRSRHRRMFLRHDRRSPIP